MIDFRLKKTVREPNVDFSTRRRVLVSFMMLCMVALVGRAVYLQAIHQCDPKFENAYQHVDVVPIMASRGMIKDRNGEPLAVSTPVHSIIINAREVKKDDDARIKQMEKEFRKQKKTDLHLDKAMKLTEAEKLQIYDAYQKEKIFKVQQIEKLLALPMGKISSLLDQEKPKQFAYLARRIDPAIGGQIKALKLAGIFIEPEYKRFYPSKEVAAHLLGFTDAKDVGQEGVEAGYEKVLRGISGSKRVIRDGQGHIVAVTDTKEAVKGKDIELSIDGRIQYLAYRELERAVTENKAKSGVLVILDAKTGELLAATNQPSFNPNTKAKSNYRNLAINDVFEPGSTVKPFVVAAGLEGGYVRPNDRFVTNGAYSIGHRTVKDVHNYGTMDLTRVIKKSSNIAVSQMALRMPPKYFWGVYRNLGFGGSADSGFPGEADGSLIDYHRLNDFARATLSFGYGVSTSALQLARAYTALADDGVLHSVSLLKRDEDIDAKRVFSAKTAKSVRAMMQEVVAKDGTAYEARVDGYTVAGKTGTVKKSGGRGGYLAKKYFSVFAGIAPAKDPRLVMVVMIDEPSAGQYYGGLVSAPVFSRVMNGALRILDIAPDQVETMPILLTQQFQ
ncbi:MAG: penicillin-binding protein 2 [Methylovulum sp.]|uniref:peptidoglycan D,D-transpeptidase FtsI family protein n=1 Tax=Methylovulum sp. TaxID=1916980 RepID=UPI0026218804|nr:penicillin-binding protein 2 [Methylovulum sp.]MDD2722925.1 penicillin-binding protein 2 [Methylovulum sp.]MDD5126247.1 penicillin-binding protein 2 [Methylovulum sp.]